MESIAGRYEPISVLGSGGMGTVMLALDNQTGEHVAIKLLHERFIGNRAYVDRFKTEAYLATRLDHPNVCRGFAHGVHNNQPWLAMEVLRGRSVAQLIAEDHCTFSIESALSVVVQAAAGLDAMLGVSGVIAHRDLSSANIFVNDDGSVKIGDFGIAKLETGNETGTGSFLGNVHYMSPEQINDPKRVDVRSDLYSLGIVFYEMLTGRRPFDGSPPQIATHHLQTIPKMPMLSGQHAQLTGVVMSRLLAKTPAERFQSPRMLIDFITAHIPEIRPVVAKPPSNGKTLLIVAALVAAVFAVGAYWPNIPFRDPDRDPPHDRIDKTAALKAAQQAKLGAVTPTVFVQEEVSKGGRLEVKLSRTEISQVTTNCTVVVGPLGGPKRFLTPLQDATMTVDPKDEGVLVAWLEVPGDTTSGSKFNLMFTITDGTGARSNKATPNAIKVSGDKLKNQDATAPITGAKVDIVR